MAGGCAWQGCVCVAGGMHGRGYAWQGGMHDFGLHGRGGMHGSGVCVVGGMHGRGHVGGMHGGGMHGRGHAWQGCVRGRKNGNCSGQYASYWNAFLSHIFL